MSAPIAAWHSTRRDPRILPTTTVMNKMPPMLERFRVATSGTPPMAAADGQRKRWTTQPEEWVSTTPSPRAPPAHPPSPTAILRRGTCGSRKATERLGARRPTSIVEARLHRWHSMPPEIRISRMLTARRYAMYSAVWRDGRQKRLLPMPWRMNGQGSLSTPSTGCTSSIAPPPPFAIFA